jgi:4-amino-4-deoxy-L-arabinose transferase-like glycosyltransferase
MTVSEGPMSSELPKAWPGAAFLVVVYLLSTGWGFWWKPITNPDEPRYACAARDMAEGTGSWLVPTFNGQPRIKKPPLIYWALATCSKIGTPLGLSTEAAFRFAPLLAGLVTVLSVYGLGRRLFNHRTGFFAGLMLVATPFVHSQWREIDTDPFLTAALTASWYFFIVLLKKVEQRTSECPWGWALAAYGAMGVACLAKGPFLLGIFFVLPVAAYLLWRDAAAPSQGRVRMISRLGLWWGIPLVIAIGLGWNILLRQTDLPQAQGQANESLRRFLGGVDHNKGMQMYPWLQYLMNVPHQFLPWSLFFLPLIPLGWREHREPFRRTLLALAAFIVPAVALRIIGGPKPEDGWQFGLFLGIAVALIAWAILVSTVWVRRVGMLSDRAKLLVCAVAIPFLFMGLVGSKRSSYLLPIFPFLTLWAAQAWDWVLSTSESDETRHAGQTRAWKIIVGGMAAATVLLPLGITLTGPLGLQARGGFVLSEQAIVLTLAMALAMVTGAAWTIRELRATRLENAARQLLLLAVASLFVHEAMLQSALDRREDLGTFYAEVSDAAGTRPLVWFGGSANEAVYYCRRTVNKLLAFSQMDDGFFAVPNAVMVVRDREFESNREPAPSLRASVRQLGRLPYGQQSYYLVEADPAHPPLHELLKGSPPAPEEPDGE